MKTLTRLLAAMLIAVSSAASAGGLIRDAEIERNVNLFKGYGPKP